MHLIFVYPIYNTTYIINFMNLLQNYVIMLLSTHIWVIFENYFVFFLEHFI